MSNFGGYSNYDELNAAMDAYAASSAARSPVGLPDPFFTFKDGVRGYKSYDDNTGAFQGIVYGDKNSPQVSWLAPTADGGIRSNYDFAPDNAGVVGGFLKNPAVQMAAAFAGGEFLPGGFFGGAAPGAGAGIDVTGQLGNAAGIGEGSFLPTAAQTAATAAPEATTGAFDLGGVLGGVDGAGGATGLGSAFGLGDATLPATLAGASGSSLGGYLSSANNFLNSGLGKLVTAAAPGVLGSVLNSSNGSGAVPDYTTAAAAQGAANNQSALISSQLSNPNINTPYGSQTVQYGLDGNPNHATINQTLSPSQQILFDQQNAISQGMGNLAQNSIGQVASALGAPFDQSKLPPQAQANQQGWQNAYDAIINRNQPLMDRDQSMLDNKLANQGIFQGSDAFKNAQFDQSQKVNDFRLGAQNQATAQEQSQFGMDSQARQDAITQQNFFRQQPLNELNALRSGSQVTNPTFQQYSGTTAQAAPLFQAQQLQSQYQMNQNNANTASNNSLTSGLFGLGAAALAAPKGTFSNIFSFGGN